METAETPEPLKKSESLQDYLVRLLKQVKDNALLSMVPLLPLIFQLDGRPYNLKHHYQFESMFRTRRPTKTVLYTARQVSKSTFEASNSILMSTCIQNFKTLFVTPLYEQARNLSTDRVRKFIDESPIKHLITSTKTENSVLRKTFTNGSVIKFTFALLSADRARGNSADQVSFDEVQDLDKNHIPIILECQSHSKYKLVQYAGTPKTFQNTLNGLWMQSSQAEWVIPCGVCGKENVCNTAQDLDQIIGPVWQPADGEPFLGTICANPRCRRLIDPARGRWYHERPELRWDMAGYHIPQHIMHVHYSDPQAWKALHAKRNGRGGYSPSKYANEVCGESCGVGIGLISPQELQKACRLPWNNDPFDFEPAVAQAEKYPMRVLAVDWGGGGEDEISFTALAVLGYLPDGTVHVIWGKRLLNPHDHLGEAAECLDVFRRFRCQFLAHDYSGAGHLRETFLVNNGLSPEKILPMAFIGTPSKLPVTYKPLTDLIPRAYYQVNKTRSLLYTCAGIKTGKVLFFRFDFQSMEDPGLVSDFFGLVENKIATSRGSDTYTIQRNALLTDDFAQAVNLGCHALWYIHGTLPTFSIQNANMTAEQKHEADNAPGDDTTIGELDDEGRLPSAEGDTL